MPRTLNEKEMKYAKALIDSTVEPAIRKIVDELNAVLKAKNIRVGAELTWMLDSTEEKKA